MRAALRWEHCNCSAAVAGRSSMEKAFKSASPDRNLHNLETKSVLKKMKEKSFAAGCNREDIRLGAEELGIEMEPHVTNVIQALRGISGKLGLPAA